MITECVQGCAVLCYKVRLVLTILYPNGVNDSPHQLLPCSARHIL